MSFNNLDPIERTIIDAFLQEVEITKTPDLTVEVHGDGEVDYMGMFILADVRPYIGITGSTVIILSQGDLYGGVQFIHGNGEDVISNSWGKSEASISWIEKLLEPAMAIANQIEAS